MLINYLRSSVECIGHLIDVNFSSIVFVERPEQNTQLSTCAATHGDDCVHKSSFRTTELVELSRLTASKEISSGE